MRLGIFQKLPHVRNVEVRDTPGADLALRFQRLEGLHRLGEGMATAPVQQVELDMVGAEALEAGFTGGDRAGAAGIVGQDLADKEHLVAPSFDRFTDDFLGTAIGIHFRRVDDGHAEIEAGAQACGLLGHRRLAFAHMPGTEAERRDLSSAGKGDCR